MAWDKGFNFRATSVYVTDGTNETYVTEDGSNAANQYPITRNGVTFGWLSFASGIGTRDRTTSNDRRLAGIHFPNAGNGATAHKFQVDLPATGQYTISLALGDASSGQSNVTAVIYDNTTSLATIGPTTTSANSFLDATGTSRTAANWPSLNTAVTLTFATTTFYLDLGNTASAGTSVLAHIFISQVATGRLFRIPILNGLGGVGQKLFNPSLSGH